MFRTALLAAAALLVAAPAFASDPASLSLTFETASDNGTVMVALYDASTYNGGQPVRVAQVDVAAGQHSVSFEGLPAGEYGVKAFHDINGDGRMNTNLFDTFN